VKINRRLKPHFIVGLFLYLQLPIRIKFISLFYKIFFGERYNETVTA